jgi:hypothetical protein
MLYRSVQLFCCSIEGTGSQGGLSYTVVDIQYTVWIDLGLNKRRLQTDRDNDIIILPVVVDTIFQKVCSANYH